MAVPTGALHAGLQDDDGWDMGRGGNDPPGRRCSIRPLVGVAYPVNPVAGHIVVFQVGIVRTIPEREAVGCDAGTGIDRSSIIIARLIVAILAHNGRCRRSLLAQACIRVVGILVNLASDVGQVETQAAPGR